MPSRILMSFGGYLCRSLFAYHRLSPGKAEKTHLSRRPTLTGNTTTTLAKEAFRERKSQSLFPVNVRSRTAGLEKASVLIKEQFLIKGLKRHPGDTGYKGRMLGRNRLEPGTGPERGAGWRSEDPGP